MAKAPTTNKKFSFIKDFFELEAAGGILLIIATFLAITVANSNLFTHYQAFIDMPVQVKIGVLDIHKPLILWINDGLMAIFFFVVGLELKREFLEGELSNFKKAALPLIGAVGGMVFPALIYWYFNTGEAVNMRGWAIPTATDIAFALGILSLLGPRVPLSLKVFLTSLAIFDDMGAILIIAIFYTEKIIFSALGVVLLCSAILFLMNKKGVVRKRWYILMGLIMWVAVLKSGVHATLGGVWLAVFIPITVDKRSGKSPLTVMEKGLHSTVSFVILPIFAFANAGIHLEGFGLDNIFHPVSLGIILGLFVGKQVGVFITCYIAIKLKLADLSEGMSLGSLYGVGILCGIGFTMSLFIGSLSFDKSMHTIFDERLGIILGSLASTIFGMLVLHFTLKKDGVVKDKH